MLNVSNVQHGVWICCVIENDGRRWRETGFVCSVCGQFERTKESRCQCGAVMDGDSIALD